MDESMVGRSLHDRLTRTIEVGENPALNVYDPFMDPDDLSFLPPDLQSAARFAPSGEVGWPVSQAAAVIEVLAGTGRLVLGLDVRDYQADGRFIEVAWSSYDGADVRDARDLALEALSNGNLPGEWVLITWLNLEAERLPQPADTTSTSSGGTE